MPSPGRSRVVKWKRSSEEPNGGNRSWKYRLLVEFREAKDTVTPSMTDSEFEHKPFSLNVYLRESVGGGGRERGRKRIPRKLHLELDLMNR